MDFYTWEKRYHLTRWMLSFLFFLLGTRNCLHIRGLVIYTQPYWLLSVSWGGLLVYIIPWLRIKPVAGEGGHGGNDTKKGFSTGQCLGWWEFSRRGVSGMILFISFIWRAPARDWEETSHPLLSDIFRAAVAVDIMDHCASLFSRRIHDTACFINQSNQIDVLPDENIELCLWCFVFLCAMSRWWMIFVPLRVSDEGKGSWLASGGVVAYIL